MLAKYGRREWMSSGIMCGFLALILFWFGIKYNLNILLTLSPIAIFLWIPFALFFRDPPRKIPNQADAIVSPADGVVKDISIEASPFTPSEKFQRIGIFLSVLDVHINRMPFDVVVKDSLYKRGSFHDARSEHATTKNESNSVLCEAEYQEKRFPIIIRQISGAIARRIVSEAKLGDKFKKGDKFGMIKFGSRTELYIPEGNEFDISVKVGDKVFAGSTIMVKIKGRQN